MRRVALGLSLAIAAALVIQATALSSGGSRDDDVLEFDTMAGVTDPFVGSAHPIRGVNGGGLPWELDEAKGELRADGRLRIEVEGLVLGRRDPVPAALQGTNPVPQFAAVVNCLTAAQPLAGENVVTAPVPAGADGTRRSGDGRAAVALHGARRLRHQRNRRGLVRGHGPLAVRHTGGLLRMSDSPFSAGEALAYPPHVRTVLLVEQ